MLLPHQQTPPPNQVCIHKLGVIKRTHHSANGVADSMTGVDCSFVELPLQFVHVCILHPLAALLQVPQLGGYLWPWVERGCLHIRNMWIQRTQKNTRANKLTRLISILGRVSCPLCSTSGLSRKTQDTTQREGIPSHHFNHCNGIYGGPIQPAPSSGLHCLLLVVWVAAAVLMISPTFK